MPTNYSLIENVKVNKIAKADYDLYVSAGIITPEMIANEVWIFTDDNFLSAENLAKLEAFLPADYYKKTEVYNKTEVQSLVAAVNTMKFLIVSALPTENIDEKTIYLTPKADSESGNAYDENMYINGAWEVIGDTTVDLSNYYKKAESDARYMSSDTDIPSQLSELSGDTTHRTVTDAEKAAWNAKSNFSGNYNDLSNKPTIPTVPTVETRIWNPAE